MLLSGAARGLDSSRLVRLATAHPLKIVCPARHIAARKHLRPNFQTQRVEIRRHAGKMGTPHVSAQRFDSSLAAPDWLTVAAGVISVTISQWLTRGHSIRASIRA